MALEELEVSIVARDCPREEYVFHACARADVMDDEVPLRGFVPDVDNNAYVVDVAAEVPRHNVSRQKSISATRGRHLFAFAAEECLQIRYATMIDVAVGSGEAPLRRVFREVPLHVFVDLFLQVDFRLAKRTDDYVRTRSRFDWHIAVRIIESLIRLIIARGFSDLINCAVDRELKVGRAVRRQCVNFSLLFWRSQRDSAGRRVPAARSYQKE